MKAFKTLFLFIFSVVLVSCFESPEFDEVPHIDYKSIYFGQSKDPSLMDSLVVELAFEDGDGDLGLDNRFRNEPFHEFDYFLTDGTTITNKVREVYIEDLSRAFLDVPDGVDGKLVRLNDIPGLPPNSCENYRTGKLLVTPEDSRVFDETYTVKEFTNPAYYEVSGTFYVDPNENNKNITVRFFTTTSNNPRPEDFVEYKWLCQDFNGRFEVLKDPEEGGALSGTLKYTMSSFGFAAVMDQNNWQLRFTIKDRKLNTSNEVSTPLFTLREIRR